MTERGREIIDCLLDPDADPQHRPDTIAAAAAVDRSLHLIGELEKAQTEANKIAAFFYRPGFMFAYHTGRSWTSVWHPLAYRTWRRAYIAGWGCHDAIAEISARICDDEPPAPSLPHEHNPRAWRQQRDNLSDCGTRPNGFVCRTCRALVGIIGRAPACDADGGGSDA